MSQEEEKLIEEANKQEWMQVLWNTIGEEATRDARDFILKSCRAWKLAGFEEMISKSHIVEGLVEHDGSVWVKLENKHIPTHDKYFVLISKSLIEEEKKKL